MDPSDSFRPNRGGPMTRPSLLASVAVLSTVVLAGHLTADGVAWNGFGGNKYFQRYSPLSQINATNVSQLQVAWRRPGLEPKIKLLFPKLNPQVLRGTPIFADGVLYAPNAVGLVEAFDPATGQTKWIQQPLPMVDKEVTGAYGQ